MKINWFKIIIYLSVIFLITFLVKNKNLVIPQIKNFSSLILSITCLFLAFLILCARWFFTLKLIKLKIKFTDALISCGLSIFAKYVPGKILMIIGKTSHLKQKYNYASSSLITASFNDQLLAIFTGILLGSLSLVHLKNNSIFFGVFLGSLLFAFLIFNNSFFLLLKMAIKKILNKEPDITILPFKTVMKLIPLHIIYWLLIGLGFYFLFFSLYDNNLPFSTIFAFPLSVVGGIISVISPGGIGIRESILAYYFSFQIESQVAITVSSISRIWFLLGEVFIFVVGFAFSIVSKIKKKYP